MKRDFTTKNYQHFLSLIQQISDEQWCGLTDWFGDGYYYVKHWLGDLGLYNKTKNLEKYHKELLDKKNTSKTEIKAIFEKVSGVDTSFSTNGTARLGECVELAETYREYVQALVEISTTSCQVVADGGKLSDFFTAKKVAVTMGQLAVHLEAIMLPISYTADNFSKIKNEYKDEYVAVYERHHRKDAATIDKVLSDDDLTADEIRDIKFLIYNAPEPYRSIYIEHINEYKQVIVYTVGSEEAKGKTGSFYNGKIYLVDKDDTFFSNPLGPYNTFFHESGHAIDDFEQNESRYKSPQYMYKGKSLNDWVTEDVTNYVSNFIDESFPKLTADQKEQIMRSMNLTSDATFKYEGDTSDLDPALIGYRNNIVYRLNNLDLAGQENEAASDVFGGVTNNAIIGGWGHYDETYWYKNGKTTNNQPVELWAEFYAAQMTHDEVSLKSIEDHFPNAYKAMEAMARDMVES